MIRPKLIFERDGWTCYLCGLELRDGSLVPHHRANRGSGGSRMSDKASNVLSLCSLCNGVIEASSERAEEARDLGIKISKFQVQRSHEIPVFSRLNGWILLADDFTVSVHEAQTTQQ